MGDAHIAMDNAKEKQKKIVQMQPSVVVFIGARIVHSRVSFISCVLCFTLHYRRRLASICNHPISIVEVVYAETTETTPYLVPPVPKLFACSLVLIIMPHSEELVPTFISFLFHYSWPFHILLAILECESVFKSTYST